LEGNDVSDAAFVKGLILVLIPVVCGVIYQAGRLSQRVDYLQQNVDAIPKAMVQGFESIARLIRDGEG
jgi:hypothetical protein